MFVGSGTAMAIAAAAMVAGAGLSYYNQEQTANRADNAEAQNIRHQTDLQAKAHQDTQQMLQKDQQNNNDQSQKSALLQSFQKAVAANQGNATGGLNQVGNVSSAYTKSANNAALGVSNYANEQGTNLAGMMAPGLQRQGENANLAQYGSQIGAINQQSQGDAAVANIKLQGIQQNPWLAAISQGLESYGSSMAGGGGGMGGMLSGGYGANGTGKAMPTGDGYQVNMPYG